MACCAAFLVALTGPAVAAADEPTVAISSPTQSSTVEGTVKVVASATASAGQTIDSIAFYDGANEIGGGECEAQPTCEASVQWKATGLSGTHTLTARAYQSDESSGTSSPVAVTVVSPDPTVSITSPTAGSTVKGTIAISVTGATDPSQEDYPTSIVVFDGVNEVGEIQCQGQQTCQGTVTWRATGLSGVHGLKAKLTTKDGLGVESPLVNVTVVSPPPTVTITSPSSSARLGGTIMVRASGETDPSQADYPTSIVVYDGVSEIGEISCQGQQTCAGSVKWETHGLKGAQKLDAVIHTQTNRSATSPRVVVGAPQPRPKPKPKPKPPAKSYVKGACKLVKIVVSVGHSDHGSCLLPGVPAGTRVAVQYRSKSSGWTTAVRNRVGHRGVFRFRLHSRRKAVYVLSLLVYPSRAYAATRLPIGTLRIG